MSAAARDGLDLSFLSREEARAVLHVLRRDSALRRAERDRISKLQKKKPDVTGQQGVTGEWFEEMERKTLQNDTEGVSRMLKQPIGHQLKKTARNNPNDLKMPSLSNPQPQKNEKNTSSSILGFRSPFAWLFSFRKSRKHNGKHQTQEQPQYDSFAQGAHTASEVEEMAKAEAQQSSLPEESIGNLSDGIQTDMMEESSPAWNEQLEEELFRELFFMWESVLEGFKHALIYTVLEGNNCHRGRGGRGQRSSSGAGPLNLQENQLRPKGDHFVSDFCMLQLSSQKLEERSLKNDGSFLMRYRMYTSVNEGLKIEVLYGDKHVAQSPYILKGPVYHEYCDCPEDPQTWQNILSCPSQEPQVTKDFTPFPTIDLQRMLEEVPIRFGKARGAIVHYTILNNHIYRRSLGKYTDFKMFSDEMLLSLARKVHLPDVEFYLNVGDWPVEHRKANDTPGPIPIISWCGSLDSRDIVLPTYDITHSTLETLRGVTNDLLSVQGNTGPCWKNKTERALFRGRDSREERLELVKLSKEHPELLDAGITGYFFFREKEKELGKAQLMGFFDFFKYKYQVNVDGTVAAYRFPYLLLGDSLVLKQDSQYYEHFYSALEPWKHYVPVKRRLEDLLEKIKWAKKNDEEARKIAKEGQLLARELLQPHRLYCYYYSVFQKYAKRQASKPEIRDGMELVPQPDDKDSVCNCHRKKPPREDL
ncbi:KDEL motif-containing protein 2 isoform A [Alligator mississippiensis]|uniref:KDEL motif-containing protein 2 isoform A n=1 Tax=Alligator mississippiensis TaxID=8496 RepID=A0A151P7M5_ALLMI|nr:KDEL motif-containing protein 2 isoform A [Alligator mississippiensis]